MIESANLEMLVQEYTASVGNVNDWATIELALVEEHEWTPEAAARLVELVRRYGSFVLRNAASLALALNIEDGNDGM